MVETTETTRHKEYSLIAAFIAVITLFIFGTTQNFAFIVVINIISIVAILASAISVVRHADVIAHRLGEPFGSLVLTLCVVLLEVCLISILMVSGDTAPTLLRDTLYAIIMIVLCGLVGISLLLGGRKHSTQYLNLAGIGQYLISIIPLAVIILILPIAFENHTFKTWQLILVSIFCVALYSIFLIVQTRTHKSFFIYEDEDLSGDSHHGKPSSHSSKWHIMWLVIHLICVIAVTKLNSGMLGTLLTTLNAPAVFTGFIVACLTLSPEGLGAIRAILNKEVQRGMNLLFGSVVATISLTVPIVVIVSSLIGKELVLGLSLANAILLSVTLLLCQSSFATGKTNKLTGIAHLVMFGAYLMVMFS
ncbi:MAG: sodium-potassium/proton antiporter ChaA [Campylobacteraceae bacterium]